MYLYHSVLTVLTPSPMCSTVHAHLIHILSTSLNLLSPQQQCPHQWSNPTVSSHFYPNFTATDLFEHLFYEKTPLLLLSTKPFLICLWNSRHCYLPQPCSPLIWGFPVTVFFLSFFLILHSQWVISSPPMDQKCSAAREKNEYSTRVWLNKGFLLSMHQD